VATNTRVLGNDVAPTSSKLAPGGKVLLFRADAQIGNWILVEGHALQPAEPKGPRAP
jgi:hypothetical protein